MTTKLANTVVLGMHRSGTSAVTGCLHALGLALPHASALFDAPGNPAHHEPRPVLVHNDDAFRTTGATWQYPVDLATPSDSWVRTAGQIIDDVFPESPWVLKEPRMSVLLDAWLPALPNDTSFVVVVRNPVEVVASLGRRNGFTPDHGAALWEIYNASLERALQGRRVMVMSFDELRTTPAATLERLATFIGLAEDTADLDDAVARAAATLDASLGTASTEEIEPYLAGRWDHLQRLAGAHDSLASEPADCAPWAVAELRRVQQVEVAARAAEKARRKPLRIALARLPILARVHSRRAERRTARVDEVLAP